MSIEGGFFRCRAGYAGIAARVAKNTAAIALMSATMYELKGKPSGIKVVAWNEPIALNDRQSSARRSAVRLTMCCSPALRVRFAPICLPAVNKLTAMSYGRWCR